MDHDTTGRMPTADTTLQDTQLDVSGMTCRSCAGRVQAALRDLDGVQRVTVDLAGGRVMVLHDPSLSAVRELAEALGAAGYPAREGGRA